MIIVTMGFYYAANNFLNYNKVYGSIGTIIAFMVWIWLNTMVILIGFELNVSIVLGKISRAKNVSTGKKVV
jgi:membrane protein